jgi:phosphate-selective porin OprO/OprP
MQSKTMKKLNWPILGLGMFAMAMAAPTWAQSAVPAGDNNVLLLDMLLKNGAITKPQYDQLVQQQAAQQAEREKTVAAAPVQQVAATPEKKDENFTLKIGGRVQADYGFVNNNKTRLGSGQEMRRMRFDISGTIYKDWAYMLSYDFASSPDEIKNAYISYIGFKDTELTVGYFKEPFSLEYQTSNKALEFQERSMLNDSFDPPKRMGIGAFRHSKLGDGEYTASVGLFGQTVPSDTEDGGDSGVGAAGRVTWAPIHTDDRLFHIGLDGEWRKPGDGEVFDLSAHPNDHMADSLIDTDTIPGVDKQTKFGAELAAVYGPLAVQGQYTTQKLKRSNNILNGGDLSFDGWYVQGSYFLTDGDSRAAFYENGSYGTVKPKGKYGAWQLGLRYDTQNLNDGDFNGGQETNMTAALNWYVNKYLRFSMNYVKVLKLDRPGNIHNDDKPDIVVARVWLGW